MVASPRQRSNHLRYSSIRILAGQAFSRAAGAPLVAGNRVRLLKDAAENYPAWLEAIRSAERTIHFENYIFTADEVGWQFAEVLAAKAHEGVRVRVIYDWLGSLAKASRRFWQSLRRPGAEVRVFNPPRLSSPLGWLSRDHRKMLTVDGRIGFVTGLCVGRDWVGDRQRGLDPWRDTGIMERMYIDDLTTRPRSFSAPNSGSTLPMSYRPLFVPIYGGRGSARRATAGIISIGNTVGAALTNRRELGPAEARVMVSVGIALIGLAVVIALWPWIMAIPLATLGVWVAISLLIRAYQLHVQANRDKNSAPPPQPAPP